MKQRKCPYSKHNSCYDYGSCEDCEWCKLIKKYERKINRLKAENATLTVENEVLKARLDKEEE